MCSRSDRPLYIMFDHFRLAVVIVVMPTLNRQYHSHYGHRSHLARAETSPFPISLCRGDSPWTTAIFSDVLINPLSQRVRLKRY